MHNKCIVRGCRHKLDDDGYPVEFCDYQQGRCPMQKQNRGPAPWEIWALIIFALIVAAVTAAIT